MLGIKQPRGNVQRIAAGHERELTAHGIQGSNTDFLICAIAARHEVSVFTTEEDFTHVARVLPIVLHPARD